MGPEKLTGADRAAPRADHAVIYDLVAAGSRVLDLGCGDGTLLALLTEGKGVRGQGIELDEQAIYRCVEKGISVFHGDIDSGLPEYPDRSFDYVILDQSLQEVRHVDLVIREALRVGGTVIVGFSNFAFLPARLMLALRGRMPITPSLPYRWHDTPNLRFLTIADFSAYCRERGYRVLAAHCLGRHGAVRFWPNLLAMNAVFALSARPGA
jgi:methionine biosynthesis protein MetW